MTMNPVVHFEMPAEDTKRMSDFYTNVFGWEMKNMGAEMGNYVVVSTSEADEKGRPKMPGAINGGFFPKAGNPAQAPMLVISVDNIEEHMKKVEAGGGKIVGAVADIPQVGKYVSFIDTEGNRMSLLQRIGM